MTTIGYLRISVSKEEIENQRHIINKSGIIVDRWVSEVVSGKVKSSKRKLWDVIHNLNKGDVIAVSEISRLGRSIRDVFSTFSKCTERGITIHITSSNMILKEDIMSQTFLFAFSLAAQVEGEMISFRTKEALKRISDSGVKLGAKKGWSAPKFDERLDAHRDRILMMRKANITIKSISLEFGVSQKWMGKYLRKAA